MEYAYPLYDENSREFQRGISVRDYFAAKAMQSLIITANLDSTREYKSQEADNISEITRTAYKIAYEMIESRDE